MDNRVEETLPLEAPLTIEERAVVVALAKISAVLDEFAVTDQDGELARAILALTPPGSTGYTLGFNDGKADTINAIRSRLDALFPPKEPCK